MTETRPRKDHFQQNCDNVPAQPAFLLKTAPVSNPLSTSQVAVFQMQSHNSCSISSPRDVQPFLPGPDSIQHTCTITADGHPFEQGLPCTGLGTYALPANRIHGTASHTLLLYRTVFPEIFLGPCLAGKWIARHSHGK